MITSDPFVYHMVFAGLALACLFIETKATPKWMSILNWTLLCVNAFAAVFFLGVKLA